MEAQVTLDPRAHGPDATWRRRTWLTLFAAARLLAVGIAATLLVAHRITDHDDLLLAVAVPYGAVTALLAGRLPRHPAVWVADSAITLALVLAGEDWRSPFYLLALTSLVLPATSLAFGRALLYTAVFTACYFVAASSTGIDWNTLETSARLESFAVHLTLPVLVGVGLTYAERLLRRLEDERLRSQRLAVESERRRLARELHDSAKQRMHAAHLVLSAHLRRGESVPSEAVGQALGDISAAIAELDASLSDLRGAPEGVTLIDDLRVRAEELEAAGGIPVRVYGSCPRLPAATAGHILHVLSEAMTNAVRHSQGSAVAAGLQVEGDRLVGSVHDDGRGLGRHDPRGHGFQSMAERAEILGGRLEVTASRLGGTTVRLEVPLAEVRAE